MAKILFDNARPTILVVQHENGKYTQHNAYSGSAKNLGEYKGDVDSLVPADIPVNIWLHGLIQQGISID